MGGPESSPLGGSWAVAGLPSQGATRPLSPLSRPSGMADLAQDGASRASHVSANGAVGVERLRGSDTSMSSCKGRDQTGAGRLDSSASDDDDRTPLKQGISFSSRTSPTSRGLAACQPATADLARLPPTMSLSAASGVLAPYAKSRGTPSSPPPRPRPQQAPATNGPQLLGTPGVEARGDGQGSATAGAGLINDKGRHGQQESQRSSLLAGLDPWCKGCESQGHKAASGSTGAVGPRCIAYSS
jgi:hypothetical protein